MSPEFARLDPAQRRIVTLLIRDAKLAGIGLEGAALARFQAIATELAEHQTAFSNHVLDATKAFALVLRAPAEVAGLPPSALDLAAQSARAAGEAGATAEAGPWRLTLDQPSLVPALQHLRRRDLRETLYRAHVARASTGKEDNTALIGKILQLRREESRLLGFATFAELSLASKMAPDVGAVRRLLEELRAVSYVAAERELAELRAFARAHGETAELTHWDIAYWAERQREERYAYSEEELRRFWPVRKGRCPLAERLPGVGPPPMARRRPAQDGMPRRRRPGPAARGVLPRSLLAARREARRRVDGRVSRPQPPLRRPARPRSPAGRAPGLQPDSAGR
jgi:oligopeptidase A